MPATAASRLYPGAERTVQILVLLKRFSYTIQYAAGEKQRLAVKAIRPANSFSFGLRIKISPPAGNQSLYRSELTNDVFVSDGN